MRRAAAILAGGRAVRMGGARKPLLAVGGVRIVERQLAVLRPLFERIVLVANEPLDGVELETVPDRRPGLGPLAGLEAALVATGAETLFLVGGDMPALSPRAIGRVLATLDADPEADAAAPVVDGRAEPLHAAYRARALPRVTALLDGGRRSMRDLLASLRLAPVDEGALRAIDPELLTLADVDTSEDLARLDERLRN